ncbi:MAG: ribulose-phosphate 3-epimerase [Coriobacteriales bacterium]|nr:ribulose-phosphate 3-epimerase [Coriobacteriales bacterium]
MAILMAPSILSADFLNLESEVKVVADNGADFIHFDVMDGHFVSNLTLGVPFVAGFKRITNVPLDVHLMVSNPEEQVPWYIMAGADLVTIHREACDDPAPTLEMIRDSGVLCGLALNPETPVELVSDYLDCVDVIMVMSVYPGFGGQSFIPGCAEKIARIASECKARGVNPIIEVDGGINAQTVKLAAAAGATMFVAGNAIFGKTDRVGAMEAIRKSAASAI